MDNQVTQLKQKIKILERQLCDRTRNYLYHFKKSPLKKNSLTKEQQCQTDNSNLPQNSLIQKFDDQDRHFANIRLREQKINILQRDLNVCQKTQSTRPTFNIQSSFQSFEKDFKEKSEERCPDINNLAQQIKVMKQQLYQQKTPRNKNDLKLQFSGTALSADKSFSNNLVDGLQFSKKKQIDRIEQQSDMKSNTEPIQKLIQYEHLSQELKIMKKEIKKLKNHLEYQIKLSSETKEALLISEEENYKFRLKIQKLNKEIQILTGTASNDSDSQHYPKPIIFQPEESALSQIESEKSFSTKEELQKIKGQAQKYQEHIFILEGVKRDYLKKCIQAKQEIYKLKKQNSHFKSLLALTQHQKVSNDDFGNLENSKNGDSLTASIVRSYKKGDLLQTKWITLLKQKVHEISNCLPVSEQNQEMYLFQPDTYEDLVMMLDRILIFCKKIELWQKQKTKTIETERSNFLKVMSVILTNYPEVKQLVIDEIISIKQMKFLVNFLNKEPKGNQTFRSCFQLSTNSNVRA